MFHDILAVIVCVAVAGWLLAGPSNDNGPPSALEDGPPGNGLDAYPLGGCGSLP
ncbi:hypothetical protein SEA_GEAZY_37 [Gordonia phage GEazy]|nr:hypothetical protein SEA_GEAZY_37 [Gordonia phage GEazy]QDF16748.1 hypothetical protein SEA_HANNAHD_35 [Gordonia phage HannahD]